jgi:hypothetical protein
MVAAAMMGEREREILKFDAGSSFEKYISAVGATIAAGSHAKAHRFGSSEIERFLKAQSVVQHEILQPVMQELCGAQLFS